VWLALGFGFATQLLPPGPKEALRRRFAELPAFPLGIAYALILGLLITAFSLERPFIYFQF
jgi:hypothetical protein